jgi:hypothetical protein
MAVSADVAVLRADDEHDQVGGADARDPSWNCRLDVAEPSRTQLPSLTRQREAGAAGMDEVELVLLVVEVRPGSRPGASTRTFAPKALIPSSCRTLRKTPSPIWSIEANE